MDKDFDTRVNLFIEELNKIQRKYRIAIDYVDDEGGDFVDLEDHRMKFKIKNFVKNIEKYI